MSVDGMGVTAKLARKNLSSTASAQTKGRVLYICQIKICITSRPVPPKKPSNRIYKRGLGKLGTTAKWGRGPEGSWAVVGNVLRYKEVLSESELNS